MKNPLVSIIIICLLLVQEKVWAEIIPSPPPDVTCAVGEEFIPFNEGISPGGAALYRASLITRADNGLIIGVNGTNGTIYVREWKDNLWLTGWYSIYSGTTVYPVKFHVDGAGNRWIYVKGNDGWIYKSQYLSQGNWGMWVGTGTSNVDFGDYGPHAISVPSGIYQSAPAGVDPIYLSRCAPSPVGNVTYGAWDTVMDWSSAPMAAQEVALLRNGKVLTFYYTASNPQAGCGAPWNGHSSPKVWDPTTNTFTDTSGLAPTEELFCSGLADMPDGRIMVVGGGGAAEACATKNARIFDPNTNLWSSVADMVCPRWYPTIITTASGKMMVFGGTAALPIPAACNPVQEAPGSSDYEITTPEIYDPATNIWTLMAPQQFALKDTYAMLYKDQGGNFLLAGPGIIQGIYNANNGALVPMTNPLSTEINYRFSTNYLSGKYLRVGFLGAGSFAAKGDTVSRAWQASGRPKIPRFSNFHLVNLPNGKVFMNGGTLSNDLFNDFGNPVLFPEIWSPDTDSWTMVAKEGKPRIYHSTALLLPNGSILSAGGDGGLGWGDFNQFTAQVYKPAYFFMGSRPTIYSAPVSMTYGQTYSVSTSASSISGVYLIRSGSMTHWDSFNHMRRSLSFSAPGGRTFYVSASANANVAPPGYYLLFVIDSAGQPSAGWWVKLQ